MQSTTTAALDFAPQRAATAAPGSHAEERGRMCVVCRRRAAASLFVHLKQVGIAPPPGETRRGRGAYVCIALTCLRQVSQKALERACREKVSPMLEGDALLQRLRELAERHVLNLLGLARRCGKLMCGIDQVERYLGEPNGLFVIANDLARRSAAKLSDAIVFLDGESLGRATGIGYVGAMGIRSGRLARQAAYWLRLWYECEGDGRGSGMRHQLEKPVEVA